MMGRSLQTLMKKDRILPLGILRVRAATHMEVGQDRAECVHHRHTLTTLQVVHACLIEEKIAVQQEM